MSQEITSSKQYIVKDNPTVRPRSLPEDSIKTKKIKMVSLSQPQSPISKPPLERLELKSRKRALESVQYENMGIKNLAKRRQGNVNHVPLSSGSPFCDEISPQNFALSIEHIAEKITSSLDIKSLFNCRLVSHKWRSVTSAELLKRDKTRSTFVFITKIRPFLQRRCSIQKLKLHR